MKQLWLTQLTTGGDKLPFLVHINDIRRVRIYDRLMPSGLVPTTCLIFWNGEAIWVEEPLGKVYEAIKSIQVS